MNKYIQYWNEIRYILGDKIFSVAIMVFFFLAASFIEIISIAMIAPYIAIITNPDDFFQSDYVAFIPGILVSEDTTLMISTLSVGLLLIFVLKFIVAIYVNKMIITFSNKHGVYLRSVLMNLYQNLPYVEYIGRNSAQSKYIVLTLSMQFSNNVLQSILRLISEFSIVLFIAVLLFLTYGKEFMIFILITGLIFLVYFYFFRRKLVDLGREVDDSSKDLIKNVEESIYGMKDIKMIKAERHFYRKIMDNSYTISSALIKIALIRIIPKYLFELVVIFFIVATSLASLATTGTESIVPILGVFGIAAVRLIPSVNQILSSVMQLSSGRNSVKLLYNDLKNLRTSSHNNLASFSESSICREAFSSLVVKNIHYSYPGSNAEVLSGVSLEVSPGDFLGITGTSGSGKSTFVDLLLGFLSVDTGNIKFNNKSIVDNIDEWRNMVSFIPQDIFLIDDTIRANVALGVESEMIDDDKVAYALEKSRLLEFCQKSDDGIYANIGEKGVKLSGGQKQRIALARAFYFDKEVLIMDESTSALDNNTEYEIIEELERLKGSKTIIVIAHRESTLRHCDSIYNIADRKMAERGSQSLQ